MPDALYRAAALTAELAAEAALTDIEGDVPARAIDALRQAGLLSAPLPLAHGGQGLSEPAQALTLLQTLAAIGRGSLVIGRLYEGHVNALQLIQTYGSAAQQRRAADDALGGHLFGVWNTEAPADGVRLVGGPGSGVLRGRKTFASGVGHVSRAVVTAALDSAADTGGGESPVGWQMLLLSTESQRPRADPTFWKPLGMRGSGSHAVDFTGHAVVAADWIGQPGDYYREPAFSGGAIRFAAVQQGGIEAVFDETRRYLAAQGRTADVFQRARMGEMAWRVESGRLWLQGAAALCGGAEPHPGDGAARQAQQLAHARLMRSAIEHLALEVMAMSDRAVGARGLLQPEPFERLHRDLTHYLRQAGPDAALVEAGRHVLDNPRPASQLWT